MLQYQFGPVWTEGVGAGTGEDGEHYFSMESSRNKIVNNMTVASSTELLSDTGLARKRMRAAALAPVLLKR